MTCYNDFSPYERVVRRVERFMEDKELHNALYKSIVEYNKPLTAKEEDKLNKFECDLEETLDIMDEIRENKWYMYSDVISMAREETI